MGYVKRFASGDRGEGEKWMSGDGIALLGRCWWWMNRERQWKDQRELFVDW
jgi:hypothetical protein